MEENVFETRDLCVLPHNGDDSQATAVDDDSSLHSRLQFTFCACSHSGCDSNRGQ